MSAISTIVTAKVLTDIADLGSSWLAGVNNTDYSDVTLTPIGQDVNGVWRFRNLSATDIVSAEALTLSSGVSGEKCSSRTVLTVPLPVTINGVSVIKPIIINFSITSHVAHSIVQRKSAFFMMMRSLANSWIKTDFKQASAPY